MKLRRTMLFVPGNNPAMARDVILYKPDAIMFDLEDAIAVTEKDSARMLTYFSLKNNDYKRENIETVVRINPLNSEFGRLDLEAIIPACPDAIRLPKAETAQDVIEVEKEIAKNEKKYDIPVGTTKMIVAIESALGVVNAYKIATASNRLIGIALGGEDYVTNLKTKRSPGGQELFFARGAIVNAGRAAGIDVIDTVYADVINEDEFIKETELIHQLGFTGKSVIHPTQILLVHKVYRPKDSDVIKSKKIIAAAEAAKKAGIGVIAVDGRMVDEPIVRRAQYILELAKASGLEVEL